MLDSAIFRRFDEVVPFGNPTRDEVVTLVQRKLQGVNEALLDMNGIYAAVANPKLGHADVCAALARVRKDSVLVGATIDTQSIISAVVKRARTKVIS
jgi:hypothetical protein